MKAQDLKKESEVIENIYKDISQANANGRFKYFIPHDVYVDESVKMHLINDGFKVYIGNWDGVITNCLIIEW